MDALTKSVDTLVDFIVTSVPAATGLTFQVAILSLCLNGINFGDDVVLDSFPKLNCEKVKRESNAINKRLISFYNEETEDRKKLKKEEYNKKYTKEYLAKVSNYILIGDTDIKYNQFVAILNGNIFKN